MPMPPCKPPPDSSQRFRRALELHKQGVPWTTAVRQAGEEFDSESEEGNDAK